MMQAVNIDILCVSETWIHPELEDRFISIPGYKLFRNDTGRGGGACMYVSQDFTVSKINTIAPKVPNVEDLWLCVQCRKFPSFVVGTIYRHPHAHVNSFDYISDVLKEVLLKNKPIFVFGDVNDDLFKPNSKLLQIIQGTKLYQLIDRPTRITINSSTLIDILITNKPDMIINFDVVPCHIADHESIIAVINLKKPRHGPEQKTYRCLRNYSPDKLCNLLFDEMESLSTILDTDDVDTQTEVLSNIIVKAIDKIAPIETVTINRPPSPWINSEIKEDIADRDRIHGLLKSDRKNLDLQNEYKNKKRQVKSSIHRAKSSYFKNEFRSCGKNCRKKWKVVKKLIPDKKSNSCSCDVNGDEKVENFNEFFSNIGRVTYESTQANLQDNFYDDPRNTGALPDIEGFRPQPVSVDTIILTFKQLNETKSVGADGLGFKFLKDSLIVLAFYFTIIINTSIVTGVYPSLWKLALVIPFYKSGDSNEAANYRPISILPILSKLLEKIIANQLMEFLENNKLLSNTQHGFRKNLSTETALIKVSDAIYNNIDNNKITLLILCDLSKAFDSINRNILIEKLGKCKIDEFWFKNYLSNRSQSVQIGKNVSSKKEVVFGVPQGSILGPLLFTIFVNDMFKVATDCDLVQYADDSQFIFVGSPNDIMDLKRQAEQTMKKAKLYFDSNGLKVNPQKTQVIFIGSRQNIAKVPSDLKMDFDGVLIEPSNLVKNLGVVFDNYMTFEKHINDLRRKTMGSLLFLNHLKDKVEKDTRIMLVQSLALCSIDYCFKIWGSAGKTQIQRVQKLQNFAAKIAVGNVRKYDRATPCINELNWLKIELKYKYELCVFMYKRVNDVIPEMLMPLTPVHSITQARTRQSENFYVSMNRTNSGGRELAKSCPRLWNTLPRDLKGAGTVTTFKRKLFEYFKCLRQ